MLQFHNILLFKELDYVRKPKPFIEGRLKNQLTNFKKKSGLKKYFILVL